MSRGGVAHLPCARSARSGPVRLGAYIAPRPCLWRHHPPASAGYCGSQAQKAGISRAHRPGSWGPTEGGCRSQRLQSLARRTGKVGVAASRPGAAQLFLLPPLLSIPSLLPPCTGGLKHGQEGRAVANHSLSSRRCVNGSCFMTFILRPSDF